MFNSQLRHSMQVRLLAKTRWGLVAEGLWE